MPSKTEYLRLTHAFFFQVKGWNKAIKVGHACLTVHKSRMRGGTTVFVQAEVNETYGRKEKRGTHPLCRDCKFVDASDGLI